jgi:serine/threonine protein kinase
MTPERWREIEKLFNELAGRAPKEQMAALNALEPELRQEVEKLLASDGVSNAGVATAVEEAAGFLAQVSGPTASVVGQSVGPYDVLSEIGRGGMGEVYLARDKRLGRQVALKFLPEEFQSDSSRRARLLTEAQAASLLHSPYIADIYDIGEEQGRAYIVMEYVEGELLSHKLEQGRLGFTEAIDIALQIAEALDEAHAKGIIHRDIKTSNLIITPRGQVKVLDFGLAKMRQHPATGMTREGVKREETMPGQVMGTVHYMSPEQARGLPVDGRTDVFSLGVVLYEMTAGQRPFDGPTSSDVLIAILEREPEPVTRYRPDIPAGLAHIIEKCLE